MLVNGDGYWLFHPEPENEWGFMFPDKLHLSFEEQQPEIWSQILPSFSGQLRTPQGVYVYTTITPLGVNYTSSTGSRDAFGSSDDTVNSDEYFWKIVSFISTDFLSANLESLKANLFGLGGFLFLLGSMGMWPLAEGMTRRKQFREQLVTMAHSDALTGLPNRALFFDRLEQALLLAARYERVCAVLYVDLDGFKLINDTQGHAAGDELLKAVGRRMVACCRTS
ncbi:MAG: GGDEF domain-containing protein, partial [Desulfuromusa sp.]|nr:GGDEF domain-containing protein [Desulfuromusa sp.]